MERIVLFGASGHAKAVIDAIEKEGKYKIAGIFVDNPEQFGTEFMGYPVVDYIHKYPSANINKGFVAIGDNYGRKKVTEKILNINQNFEFVTIVHPTAIIAKGATVGKGTIIKAGAILEADSTVGNHCIVNTTVTFGHDCVLGDCSTLSPGVNLGGNTIIGSNTAISMNSVIIEKTVIGDNVVIGAGSVVTKNIENNVVAYGSPAKIVRTREENSKYVK